MHFGFQVTSNCWPEFIWKMFCFVLQFLGSSLSNKISPSPNFFRLALVGRVCQVIGIMKLTGKGFIAATGTKEKFSFHQYHSVLQIPSSTPYVIHKQKTSLLQNEPQENVFWSYNLKELSFDRLTAHVTCRKPRVRLLFCGFGLVSCFFQSPACLPRGYTSHS